MKKASVKSIVDKKIEKKPKTLVVRDPVLKGDRFEHEGVLITKVFREGKVLYELGKKMKSGKVVHLEVDPNPGSMDNEEIRLAGYNSRDEFVAAWVKTYDADKLWRPAWRIELEKTVEVKPLEKLEEEAIPNEADGWEKEEM